MQSGQRMQHLQHVLTPVLRPLRPLAAPGDLAQQHVRNDDFGPPLFQDHCVKQPQHLLGTMVKPHFGGSPNQCLSNLFPAVGPVRRDFTTGATNCSVGSLDAQGQDTRLMRQLNQANRPGLILFIEPQHAAVYCRLRA